MRGYCRTRRKVSESRMASGYDYHTPSSHPHTSRTKSLILGFLLGCSISILVRSRVFTIGPRVFLTVIIISLIFPSLPDCPRGSDPIIKRSIAHAFYNCLPESVDFLWVVGTKRCGDCRTIIHPTFQFELSNHLVAIGFDSALSDLVTSDVWFVQVMYKVDCQLDQKVSLCLRVIWIVEPVIKVTL